MDPELFKLLVDVQSKVQTFGESVPRLQDDVRQLTQKLHEIDVLVARIEGAQGQIAKQLHGVQSSVTTIVSGLKRSDINFKIDGDVKTINNEER